MFHQMILASTLMILKLHQYERFYTITEDNSIVLDKNCRF